MLTSPSSPSSSGPSLSLCVCVSSCPSSSTGPPRWLSSDTAFTVVSLRLDCVSKKVSVLLFSRSFSCLRVSSSQGFGAVDKRPGWFIALGLGLTSSNARADPLCTDTALWQSIGCNKTITDILFTQCLSIIWASYSLKSKNIYIYMYIYQRQTLGSKAQLHNIMLDLIDLWFSVSYPPLICMTTCQVKRMESNTRLNKV